jgi:pseudouridine-5'-phosphate glycosidase
LNLVVWSSLHHKPFFSADSVINNSIADALKSAEQNGIAGKEVTPFILAAIAKITAGKSLQTSMYS